jgi:hypothetical protein
MRCTVQKLALVIGTTALFAGAPALARDVAGVDVAETLSVDGKTLKLNGAGIRKKVVVKVYVGALYLENTSSSVDEILKTDQARVIKMTFVRDVGKDKILDAYWEGFEKNSKDELPKLKGPMDRFRAGLGDMKSGKQMTVTYVPGKGVTIAQQDGGSVTVSANARQLSDALMRVWIGDSPADSGLKAAMLAGK